MSTTTSPRTITVALSDLLAAYSSDATATFLCSTLPAVIEAQHRRLPPSEQPTKLRPPADSTQFYETLLQAMPLHIVSPRPRVPFLSHWLKDLPPTLQNALETESQRKFRMKFLQWAIANFNDPTLTYTLE